MKFIYLFFIVPGLFATPKNLIFIVADGMGIASVTGTRVYYKGAKGKLNIESFKTIGLSKTFSANDYTTDSAAAATAMASGVKTYNGAIGLDINKKELKTIFDIGYKAQKKLGIVTTTSVTHATPAAFYAHAKNRYEEKEISKQVKSSNLDFLLGGGKKYFKKSELKLLKKQGWKIIKHKKNLKKSNKKILGIFAKTDLSYSVNNKHHPELIDLVKFGHKRLKASKKGYMFLIEAGRIDHAGHANLAKEHFGEVIALDKVIDYLLKNVDLKNTLIVLTSDHETGGLSLSGHGKLDKVKGEEFLKGNSSYGNNPYISWATGPAAIIDPKIRATYPLKKANHTTVDVPVYSIGNGHEKMGGFMNNNEIPHKILKIMGLENF